MIKIYNSGKVLVRTRIKGRRLSKIVDTNGNTFRVFLTDKESQNKFTAKIGKGLKVYRMTVPKNGDRLLIHNGRVHIPGLTLSLIIEYKGESGREEILKRLREQNFFITIAKNVIKRYD